MSVWTKILHWLGLEGRTHVKVYHGIGGVEQLEIYGHVLDRGPLPAVRYSRFVLFNMMALLRLFMVKPREGAEVQLIWEGKVVKAVTESDGFFHMQWVPEKMPEPGDHIVEVMITNVEESPVTRTMGVVIIPHRSQFGCISDIDDTFLVSHSASFLKRLHVLFTRNARTRKPFEGVVNHYQLLSDAINKARLPRPFFYVSSSEWNLYAYIREFCRMHKLPEGVFLLNQIKPLYLLLKSGQQKHATKFTRITRILKHYPHMRFILLGDDSQEDPHIYEAITKHFTSQIVAVYLRHVRDSRYAATQEVAAVISGRGIPCCYFKHSSEAIAHSKELGLIVST
jgi:phosphatidate phosphatase APP1